MDSAGAVKNVNVFAPDGLVARKEGSTWTYYTFDPQGNVLNKLDASQNVTAGRLLDAWGQGVETTLPRNIDPWGYNAKWGYYYDRETQLYLCQHRMYDASTGRWLNRDPIGLAGGMNLYGYCGSGPVGAADPSGHQGMFGPGGPFLAREATPDFSEGAETIGAGLLTSAISLGHSLLSSADALLNDLSFSPGEGDSMRMNGAAMLDPYMNRPGGEVAEGLWDLAGLLLGGADCLAAFSKLGGVGRLPFFGAELELRYPYAETGGGGMRLNGPDGKQLGRMDIHLEPGRPWWEAPHLHQRPGIGKRRPWDAPIIWPKIFPGEE